MTYRLAVLGGGNMGTALVQGLLSAGWAAPDELVVVEVLAAPAGRAGGGAARRRRARPARGVLIDAAVVAVKPADVPAAARAATEAGALRLLSVAAGVPTSAIERAAGTAVRVVRAMPNTPALVGAGAAAIAPGTAAREDDLAWAEGILRSVGTVVRVPERRSTR